MSIKQVSIFSSLSYNNSNAFWWTYLVIAVFHRIITFFLCHKQWSWGKHTSPILQTHPGKALETAQAHLLMQSQENNPHIRVERGGRGYLIDVDTYLTPRTGQASHPCLSSILSPHSCWIPSWEVGCIVFPLNTGRFNFRLLQILKSKSLGWPF